MTGEHQGVPSPVHATWSDVEYFLNSSRSTTFPLHRPGQPRVDYVVTDDRSVALHLQLGSRQRLPRSPLPLIRIDEFSRDGLRMARIRLVDRDLLRDFHDLLNAVADRVIVHNRTPEQAFRETVRAWSALLSKPRALSTERRIGLIGELMVLNTLADYHGWNTAVAGWKGPDNEEHDFGLPKQDVEVKTTSEETRHHQVQGLGQLTPAPGRPLWLVSVQLTRGGAAGRTLRECVQAMRERMKDSAPAAVDHFDVQLDAAGWSFNSPDDERWSLRSTPLALPVGDRFPRLDVSLLDALPDEIRQRIDQLAYRIDLSGIAPLSPSELPPALGSFLFP